MALRNNANSGLGMVERDWLCSMAFFALHCSTAILVQYGQKIHRPARDPANVAVLDGCDPVSRTRRSNDIEGGWQVTTRNVRQRGASPFYDCSDEKKSSSFQAVTPHHVRSLVRPSDVSFHRPLSALLLRLSRLESKKLVDASGHRIHSPLQEILETSKTSTSTCHENLRLQPCPRNCLRWLQCRTHSDLLQANLRERDTAMPMCRANISTFYIH